MPCRSVKKSGERGCTVNFNDVGYLVGMAACFVFGAAIYIVAFSYACWYCAFVIDWGCRQRERHLAEEE